MPMHARAQRLARGWLVGLVATTIAAVSHALAGGYRPDILSFGAALIFAGILGTAVIGTKPSLPRLAFAVGGAQLAFHLLFSLLGVSTVSTSGASTGGAVGGMQMPGMEVPTGAVSTISTGGIVASHDHLADPGMWAAHAVAAVLTILFLRHAELAVWSMLTRLGHLIATRLIVVLAPVPVRAIARVPAGTTVLRTPIEPALTSSASRRGPPLLAF